ncbi:hypothetical protein [Rhodocytophaga rosea]|uniref:hypothetical protein n=1 Tax=Rhodocytophaga rosea TaxID=2704465 RepID=UPI001E46E156|nr:hypothetical protein [Rhodocytophaga rosea]
MTTQAWNIYSYAVPIIIQFFGIKPRAFEKTIYIQPQMPSGWENAKLNNSLVGDNSISISYQRKANSLQFDIKQSKSDWKLVLAFPAGKYNQWQVNGKTESPHTQDNLQFLEISGQKAQLILK